MLNLGSFEEHGPEIAPEAPNEPAVRKRRTLTIELDDLLPTGELSLPSGPPVPLSPSKPIHATVVGVIVEEFQSAPPFEITFRKSPSQPSLKAKVVSIDVDNSNSPVSATLPTPLKKNIVISEPSLGQDVPPPRPVQNAPVFKPFRSPRNSPRRNQRQAVQLTKEDLQLVVDPLGSVPIPIDDLSMLTAEDGTIQLVSYIRVFSRQVQ